MAEVAKKGHALQGFLQALQPAKVRGWAFMAAHPDEHLRIEVRVDGTLVTQTIASMHFTDLQKHNIGNGDHGFLIIPKRELPVDEPERVQVVALGSDGTRRVLQLSSTARARAGIAAPAAAEAVAPEPVVVPKAPAKPPAPAARARQAVAAAAVTAEPPAPPAATANPASVETMQHPVFVLGSARSGTTAMMLALRHSGRYEGYNEGHLLPLFARLQNGVNIHYARSLRDAAPGMNTLIANVPARMVTEALQSAFATIMRATFPTGYWLDKTPGPDMIKAVPLLRRIWPEARYIFLKRRPVDNIESRRRKFPSITFKDHCRLWADSMMSWHAIRDDLAGVSLEVDQVRMAHEPEQVAGEVASLLDLTPTETARLLASFKSERPQRTGKQFADIQNIDNVDWSEEQRATFDEVCAEAIELFGYDTDLAPAAGRARKDRPNLRKPASC